MGYNNYYDNYNDGKSLYDYQGPKSKTKRRWFVLLMLFLFVAIPVAIRYLVPEETYVNAEKSLVTWIYLNRGVFIATFVILGIIFGIMEVKYERVDAEIAKVADINYGHDISFLGIFSYITTAVSSKHAYIFSRDDLSTFYTKRKWMLIVQGIYKFLFPLLIAIIMLTATFYRLLPTDVADFSKILDYEYLQYAFVGSGVNYGDGQYLMLLLVMIIIFLVGNIDILLYFLIRLVPFGESFKADVTYERTTRYSDGTSHTSHFTREETFSTTPIFILIAIVCYFIFSFLSFIPIANVWCRLRETSKVKKFFDEYPEANTIEDYYQSTVGDYYATNR